MNKQALREQFERGEIEKGRSVERDADGEYVDGVVFFGWLQALSEARGVSLPVGVSDGWIAVTDRMPEKGKPVQVWCDGSDSAGVAWRTDDAWYMPEPQALGYESITHWQPLAAAPTVKESLSVASEPDSGWVEPVALTSCSPDYDAGWRDGISEAKRLNAPSVKAEQVQCDACEEAGVFGDDGSGPFDCYECGKKAAAQTASELAESRAVAGVDGAAQAPSPPAAGSAEWIEHGPSKAFPFGNPYTSKVDVRLRDGTERLGDMACNTMWFWYEHDPKPYDVVAYRIAALSGQQSAPDAPERVSVPVELLETACYLLESEEPSHTLRELRAILASHGRGEA